MTLIGWKGNKLLILFKCCGLVSSTVLLSIMNSVHGNVM